MREECNSPIEKIATIKIYGYDLLWVVKLVIESVPHKIMSNFSGWRQPSRVTFGHGWVRKSAWELFSETVNLYEPIIPELSNEKLEVIRKGKVSKSAELNLHMGTT